MIAVNLSDYVSGQILAYPQAGSDRKGDGIVCAGRRVGGVIKKIFCYLSSSQ